jgi:hypothetical protein
MSWREALFGLVSAAILSMPVLVAIFYAPSAIRQRRTAASRRIASYRKSPLSRLLILNDRSAPSTSIS